MSNRLDPVALAALQARIRADALAQASRENQAKAEKVRRERICAPTPELTEVEKAEARETHKLARKRQQADSKASVGGNAFSGLRDLRGIRGPDGRFLRTKNL